MIIKARCLMVVLWLLLVFVVVEISEAKSVYAITQHHVSSIIKAYNINENEIEYQEDVDASAYNPGNGAVGLCVWEALELMFLTYETSDTVVWSSTKTLEKINQISTGTSNLAGIVADEGKNKLYIIKRFSEELYVYTWDEENETLVLEHPNDPNYPDRKYHPLENISNAYGLALDEDNDLLYVTDATKTVRYYDTADWSYQDDLDINNNREAVGIAIDYENGYLYTGGYGVNNYMVKTYLANPNDPNKNVEVSNAYATGLAVDQNTGVLYITSSDNKVQVFDPLNWPSDANNIESTDTESNNISGPAGIAVGSQYKPADMTITKTDGITDPNICVDPNDTITYTICYAPGEEDETNVVVTDTLPIGVTFESADPNTGTYYPANHTYIWDDIGFVGGHDPNDPNDPNECLELTVRVNDSAEPSGLLINKAEVESDNSYAYDTEETLVCCFGGDIIYVDAYASGSEAGTSWTNAYTDLQDALARADNGCDCNEIWVANGIYSPGNSTGKSFTIPDYVEVYGGFAGNETSWGDRDYIANKTYLVGNSGTARNEKIVTMGNGTVLDGFIVTEGIIGIYGTNDNFTVSNCVIADNTQQGIYSESGNATVNWCVIKDNNYDGIQHIGSGKTLTVENCMIYENQQNGINTFYSVATILNSLIYENGSDIEDTYYGISINQPSNNPEIRNCTIVYNTNEGIYYTGSNDPCICNDILWHNNEDGGLGQLAGCDTTYFSCVYDPNNDPNATSTYTDGNGNITRDPNFAYDYGQFGYYHLDPGSACVNKGDPYGNYTGEKDIDDDERIYNDDDDIVDMGADEVSCSDYVSNETDWNGDGLVNMVEFGIFAEAWLSQDPNYGDPNFADDWDTRCDLVADYEINIEDYTAFCEEWLWEACWRCSSEQIWMMMAGGGDMAKMMESQLLTIDSRDETFLAAKSIPVPQLTLAEQAAIISENLDFLEKIWETEEDIQKQIDEETWDNFIDSLQKELKYLEEQI